MPRIPYLPQDQTPVSGDQVPLYQAATDTTTRVSVSALGAVVNAAYAPVQAAAAPAYVKGGLYFDTTLNKLRVGGATAWETVTSS